MNGLTRWLGSPAAFSLAMGLVGLLLVHVGIRSFNRRWPWAEAGSCKRGQKRLARKRLAGLLMLGTGAALLAAGIGSVDWHPNPADEVRKSILPVDTPAPRAPRTY